MKPRRWLHYLAELGRPLLRIFGVKKGTVADKAAEAAEVVDQVLPPEKPTH